MPFSRLYALHHELPSPLSLRCSKHPGLFSQLLSSRLVSPAAPPLLRSSAPHGMNSPFLRLRCSTCFDTIIQRDALREYERHVRRLSYLDKDPDDTGHDGAVERDGGRRGEARVEIRLPPFLLRFLRSIQPMQRKKEWAGDSRGYLGSHGDGYLLLTPKMSIPPLSS